MDAINRGAYVCEQHTNGGVNRNHSLIYFVIGVQVCMWGCYATLVLSDSNVHLSF